MLILIGELLIFEFERVAVPANYRMLHLGMHVERLKPPAEKRMPGVMPAGHLKSYSDLTKRIFSEFPIEVKNETIDQSEIENDLAKIVGRRKKIVGE